MTSAEDILAGYDVNVGAGFVPAQIKGLNELEQNIIKKLQEEPMEIDALARTVGSSLQISEIATALSLMQIKGLVFEEVGKYYIKTV
ncbi:MAG: hypothetical protein P9M02_02685 [Candidatus Susulua stagnicola]|nr:hypothetical protein [Candidatus Susulua stagnicola]